MEGRCVCVGGGGRRRAQKQVQSVGQWRLIGMLCGNIVHKQQGLDVPYVAVGHVWAHGSAVIWETAILYTILVSFAGCWQSQLTDRLCCITLCTLPLPGRREIEGKVAILFHQLQVVDDLQVTWHEYLALEWANINDVEGGAWLQGFFLLVFTIDPYMHRVWSTCSSLQLQPKSPKETREHPQFCSMRCVGVPPLLLSTIMRKLLQW